MTIKTFCETIKGEYAKRFPDSLCVCQYSEKMIYRSITIRCFLAKNKEESLSGYLENDMLDLRFCVELEGEKEFAQGTVLESDVPENIQLKAWESRFTTIPTSQYMCYSSERIPFRMSKGNAEKIVATFAKHCDKTKDALKAAYGAGKIHKNYIDLFERKVI